MVLSTQTLTCQWFVKAWLIKAFHDESEMSSVIWRLIKKKKKA